MSDSPARQGTPFDGLILRLLGGIISLASLGFLLVGIVDKGVRWELHWAIAILLLFCSLFLLFLLEGTQIAVVRLKQGDHIPPVVWEQSPEVAKLLTEMGEYGVAMYLIGRQVLVCGNVYLVAALTELADPLVSRVITIFAGIFTVVCFGQLIPQLAADVSPILFCRIPAVRQVILLSAFISKCGVGHFSYYIGQLMLDYLKGKNGPKKESSAGDEAEQPDISLVSSEDPKTKMQNLSSEIFKTLNAPVNLDTKSKEHISPHILLAIATGLNSSQTSAQAEKLLMELLFTIDDQKTKDSINSFVRDDKVTSI